MESAQKTVSKFIKDVTTIPTDERVRQVEHAIGLAVAIYGSYSVLCTLGWVVARPSEAKDYVIESIVEVAKVLPPVQAYLAEEEAKNLGPIRTQIHGAGDSSEKVAACMIFWFLLGRDAGPCEAAWCCFSVRIQSVHFACTPKSGHCRCFFQYPE
jgi:hypothetical protein